MSAALAIQVNVVWALLLREMRTRFGRSRLGYLWAVLGPLATLAVLIALFSVIGRMSPPGLEFPPFLITGIIPWFMFNNITNRAMRAISSNQGLLVYDRVKPLDLLVTRSLLETVTYLVVFVLLLALVGTVGYQAVPDEPLTVLVTLLGLALLSTGLGAAIAGGVAVFPAIEHVVPVVKRPLFFLSGIFFSIEMIPEPYRSWLLWNPLLHGNELMRAGFFANYDGRYADPVYLVAWIVGAVFAGLLIQRACRRWVTVAA